MPQEFGITDVCAAMTRMAAALRASADDLTALDQAIGDGDLGITATKFADALDTYVSGASDGAGDDIGKFIAGAGMAANRVASSTMGTLLATAAMRAGKVVKGAGTIQTAQLGEMLQAGAQGMQDRGKAELGNKTILDALFPAAAALSDGISAGKTVAQSGQEMVQASVAGRDRVTPLRNTVGRAGWIGERTEGQVDPGCELCVRVLGALAGATA